MYVRGIADEATIRRAVQQTSEALYDGNIRIKDIKRVNSKCLSFTLDVADTKGPGSRRAARAACWHAHRDVMLALFAVNPDTRITTMCADYRGLVDFLHKFEETGEERRSTGKGMTTYARICGCPSYGEEDVKKLLHAAMVDRDIKIRRLQRELAELQGADTVAILRDLRQAKRAKA